MPNLVGIFDPTAEPAALGRQVRAMMDAVDLPGFDFARRDAAGEGVACGNVLPGITDDLSQPAKRGDRWLMLDGELLDVDGARALLPSDTAAEGDAALALALYDAHGLDFVDHLNGTWNIVLHDAGTTYVITDRIGSRILFVAHDADRVVFATEAKAVVAGRTVATRAGGSGLLQLFAGATPFGDATWLEGIDVLGPGTILRLNEDGRTSRRYWRFHFREGGPQMSERAYADGFAHRLAVATERCMKDAADLPVGITLSGGLDSRSIALSLARQHLPIPSLTYGDPDSADAIYAAQLAEVIGFDHHYVEAQRPKLIAASNEALDEIIGRPTAGERGLYGSQVDRVVWRGEGMGPFAGMASMVWHPLYQKHMRVFLNGACGDALTGSHLSPKLLAEPSRRKMQAALFASCVWQGKVSVQRVLTKRFVDRWWEGLEAEFAETFATIDADEPMAVWSVWDMENRQRRGAFATFTIERYFCTCRAPYLDYDLAAFLASVPPMWRFQQRVYKRMIVEHFPQAAHVPWAYTRGKITTSPTYEFAREVANFASRKLSGLLPQRKNVPEHYAFRDVNALVKSEPELVPSVRRWVKSDGFDSAVFDAAGIEGLLAGIERGEGGDSEITLLSHLCAMARSHEWFLTDGVKAVPAQANPATFGVTGWERS